MKKCLALVLIVFTLFGLTACGNKEDVIGTWKVDEGEGELHSYWCFYEEEYAKLRRFASGYSSYIWKDAYDWEYNGKEVILIEPMSGEQILTYVIEGDKMYYPGNEHKLYAQKVDTQTYTNPEEVFN